MRPITAASAGVLVASLLFVGCGSSSSKTSTSTKDDRSASTSTSKPAPGSGSTLVSPAKLKGALLTAREAGTGWTLISTGSGSGTNNPGPTTTQPKGGSSSPSLANVHTTPQCKAMLSNFDLASPVKNTAARGLFTKADQTKLAQVLVSTDAKQRPPSASRAAIAKCKKISITTGVGRATVDLAPFALPKLGDDSLGVKMTVTVSAQGKTVVLNEYLALIKRGNTADALVLGDAPANGGPAKKVDPATLGPLAQKADAKVAKVT